MIKKFSNFLNENVDIQNLGKVKVEDLKSHLAYHGMSSRDIFHFCSNSTVVKKYKINIPFSLNFTEIFEKKFNVQGLHNVEDEETNFENDITKNWYGYYWINMGNGLTSIAEEVDDTFYTIYSGEEQLNKFIEEELEVMLSSEKYNL